ncbi:uncharacterized protein LOC128961998 [Oppia nitens]|uniref:uncharacterized protein LOC128961998 n=1 Tax=Oppia nitens TaxID=1686743 RepID=UPI0023DC877A|nr:uncharacterized protein LOC128961998 [Oppia nitens]
MCDQLYLLAKGGHCIYWGPHRDLWQHMADCQIVIGNTAAAVSAVDGRHRQVLPIDTVINIGSMGTKDADVQRLINRMDEIVTERLRDVDSLLTQTIAQRQRKRFSLRQCLILIGRTLSEIYAGNWQQLAIHLALMILSALIFPLTFPTDVGASSDCLQFGGGGGGQQQQQHTGRSCFDQVVNNDVNFFNFSLIGIYVFIHNLLQGVISVARFDPRLRRFQFEHQNAWYSTGTFLLTESIISFVLITINTTISTSLVYYTTGQPRESGRYWPFLYGSVMFAQCTDVMANLVSLLLLSNRPLSYMSVNCLMIMTTIFSNMFIRLDDIGRVGQWMGNLYPGRFASSILLMAIYGQNRCPEPSVSNLLYTYNLNDPRLLVEYCLNMVKLFVGYRIGCLVVALILNNPWVWQSMVKLICCQKGVGDSNHRKTVSSSSDTIEMSTLAAAAPGGGGGGGTVVSNNSDSKSIYYDCYETVDELYTSAADLIEYNLNKQFNDEDNEERYQQIAVITTTTTTTVADDNHCPDIRSLCIGWSELTIRLDKTFCSPEKLILRSVSGCVEFGTLTALMGPSGAGKTSLLLALNGRYQELMTRESMVYMSPNRRVRRCFIGQDQREHLMTGLTVRQSIVYASKLKNSSAVSGDRLLVHHSHESIARKLMQELALTDLRDIDVSKCSSGQQKRVVMAMELTARRKPNLICVDEPTSGVDSYSAQLMIKCFRRLAKRHRLSIITSIHQPNMDIIELYDQLYILAKGGITVYSGRASGIGEHLHRCMIDYCPHSQIALEVIVRQAANGPNDGQVLEMQRQTQQQQFRAYTATTTTTCANITTTTTTTTKHFSFQEFYQLLARYLLYNGQYGWRLHLCYFNILIGLTLFTRIIFSLDLEASDSCVDITANQSSLICLHTPTTLRLTTLLIYNYNYLRFIAMICNIIQLVVTSITFSSDFRLFLNENRNNWYSTESYYLVKQLMDIVPALATTVSVVFIVDIYVNRSMTWSLAVSLTLSTLSFQSMGHIVGILFPTNATVVSIMIIPILTLTSNTIAPTASYNQFIKQLSNLSVIKQSLTYLLIAMYGFDRCPQGSHISSMLYRYSLTDGDYRRDRHLLIVQLVIYKLLTYILLKLKVNYDNWFRLSTARQLCCRLKFF